MGELESIRDAALPPAETKAKAWSIMVKATMWASVAQQQDAHEFMRVLFERIENELKKHDNIRSCVASRLRVRGGQQCRAFHDLRYVL